LVRTPQILQCLPDVLLDDLLMYGPVLSLASRIVKVVYVLRRLRAARIAASWNCCRGGKPIDIRHVATSWRAAAEACWARLAPGDTPTKT
jgi:hypothetical protein